MPSRLSMEVVAIPAGVPSARGAITRLCEHLGIDAELADRIRIAATEACTNCVLHAYSDEAVDSTFALEARVERDTLLIVVRDYGRGFAPGGASRRGGLRLGLKLISDLADDTCVSSRPGRGTRVAMRFALTPELRMPLLVDV